jgi:hypothetical protein
MKVIFTLLFTAFTSLSFSQSIDKIINADEVARIENVLSSDKMQGRKTFTPSIDSAADFIANEFKKSGLKFFDTLNSYKQTFFLTKAKVSFVSGEIEGKKIEADKILAVTKEPELIFDESSDFREISIGKDDNFVARAFELIRSNKKYLVFTDTSHFKNFERLRRFQENNFNIESPVIFVLTNENPSKYHFNIKSEITSLPLTNVVGVIPGKGKKDEYVIFSAHYDHLGIGKPDAKGDSIYNGANDDAAGTTAVIMLTDYFSKLNNNERTLIFITFTAEEIGDFGSQHFSRQIDPEKTVAMFNIEMIGTESKWGKNSAYITGYEKSDFGKILQANLVESNFHFEPDPYPKQNLFYRSDNATLAALGVPAHTISTSKMDNEPNYHQQSDEITTLDMNNMAEIIKAIAISSKTIVSGKDTPTRVEKKN